VEIVRVGEWRPGGHCYHPCSRRRGESRGHVISIHCKDGVGPSGPGQLGSERTLGEGQVDFPGFLNLLQQIGYKGPLTIEREAPDPETRKRDVRTAIVRLKEWKALLKQKL